MIIRQAARTDSNAIAQIEVAGWHSTYGHLLSEKFWAAFTNATRRKYWNTVLNTERSVWVALQGDEVVGFIYADVPSVLQAEDQTVNLHELYIRSDAQGQGVGGGLLSEVLGNQPARLWVEEGNSAAQQFYARYGFRKDGLRKSSREWEGNVGIRMSRS